MRTLPTISKQTTSTSLWPWSLRTEQNFNGEMVSEGSMAKWSLK